MIMDMGPHAAFIFTAYGATALVITALIARAIRDEQRQKRILVKLEEQGVRRRSARPGDSMK
jgi:heme exporter protein D